LRVLVADDDLSTRELVVNYLQKWGYEVVACQDGDEALSALLGKKAPRLAILDWNMPGLTGIEVIKRMRLSAQNYCYTILLTSNSSRQDMLTGFEMGADDYVAKPYDQKELKARALAGERIVRLRDELDEKNKKLSDLNAQLLQANERMQRDHALAANFQRSLLPKYGKDVPGFHVQWLYQPCDELAGDLFNIFQLDEKHYGFYLLDVSGHGVAASFLTANLHRALSPSLNETLLKKKYEWSESEVIIESPKNVLAKLNSWFQFDEETGSYFTIVYGVLNLETRKVRISSAGHPAPIVVGRDGALCSLSTPGSPIGFLKSEVYHEKEIKLNQGDRLFLYSDALYEAENDSEEFFGLERVEKLFQENNQLILEKQLQDMVKEICEWSGAPQNDDISILALEAL